MKRPENLKVAIASNSQLKTPLQVELCIEMHIDDETGLARGSERNNKVGGFRKSRAQSKVFFHNSKEPTNLFRCWCHVKTLFNLLTPSATVHGSRLERRKKNCWLFPFTLHRPTPRRKEREKCFLDITCSLKRNKKIKILKWKS